MQVKCPNCSVVLKIADAAAPTKVKCPKCSTILKIGRPPHEPKRSQSVSANTGQVKPQASSTAQTAACAPAAPLGNELSGSFDFLDLPEPATQEVRQFQQVGPIKAYNSPAATVSQTTPAADPSAKPKAGLNKAMIAAIVGGVSVLLLIIGIGVTLAMRGGSPGKTSTASAKNVEAPPGFSYYETNGVSVFMPDGQQRETFQSSMEMKAVMTPMGTTFLLACTPVGNKPMEFDKLRQRVDRLMASGVVGGMVCERNGLQGNRAVLDQSIYLPTMDVEIYQEGGRIIVIGVTSESSGGGNYVVGQKAEPELQKTFFESFAIEPVGSSSSW